MEKFEVIYFFRQEDYLSQWYYSPFILNNIQFSCCEQWMMYSKAVLFGDSESARAIALECSPGKQKEIGRKVNGFRDQIWNENRERIVYEGNVAKFTQNDELKRKLLSTGNYLIAEANPKDPIWGIGLSESDARKRYPSQWRGKNLLGKILMQIRDEIR